MKMTRLLSARRRTLRSRLLYFEASFAVGKMSSRFAGKLQTAEPATCLGRIATGRPIRGVNRKTGRRLTARRGILAPDRRCDSPAFNREAHGRDLSATA